MSNFPLLVIIVQCCFEFPPPYQAAEKSVASIIHFYIFHSCFLNCGQVLNSLLWRASRGQKDVFCALFCLGMGGGGSYFKNKYRTWNQNLEQNICSKILLWTRLTFKVAASCRSFLSWPKANCSFKLCFCHSWWYAGQFILHQKLYSPPQFSFGNHIYFSSTEINLQVQ